MVAALMIGDELLSGQTEDKNLKYMLKSFSLSGHKLSEVRWVGDDIDLISIAFKELSNKHDYVISSGGVGPTHDDVTIEAISLAFNEKLVLNSFLEKSLISFYKDKINKSALRMAMVPESTELIDENGANWPIMKVRNCFILPGVPQIFQQKFDRLVKQLPEGKPHFVGRFQLNADEVFFANELSIIQDKNSDILIGSYPIFGNQTYRTEVTIKHTDLTKLELLFLDLEQIFKNRNFLVKSFRPRIK